jgi:hypothetical protein
LTPFAEWYTLAPDIMSIDAVLYTQQCHKRSNITDFTPGGITKQNPNFLMKGPQDCETDQNTG